MPEDLSQSGAEGGGSEMGGMSSHFGMLKAGFKVDTKAVKDLRSEFDTLHKTLKDVKKTMEDISKLSGKLAPGGPVGGGASMGGAVSPAAKIQSMSASNSDAANAVAASGRAGMAAKMRNVVTGVRGAGGAAAAGAAGGAGAAGAAAAAGPAAAAMIVADVVKGVTTAIGSAMYGRIDRAYDTMLSYDKMNLRLQQTTGMSALDVQQQLRQPLMQYRLGPDGTNTALSLTRATGLTNVGRDIESLRTMSGFAFSSEDASRIMQSLSSPQVANRMFRMSGGQIGIYGFGGQQRSVNEVFQGLINRVGLTSRERIEGGRQQGSMQRVALSAYGLPTDLQDVVLDYAEQNISFRERGGQGAYDPANRTHQEIMGITGSFALQKEESDRRQAERDESFYRKQIDNYADLEKATQTLTATFQTLEEVLSPLIGGATSNRPFLKMAKGILDIIPGANIFTGLLGDPVPDPDKVGGSAGATMPTYSGRKPISSLESMSSFSKMHPKMKERVKNLILASGGRVGFGGGTRNSSSQRTMFLDRYYVVTGEDYDVEWEGKRWKKRPGVAAAAPPGRSMHEIGLAADLTGDMDWIVKNASRFGLRSFHDVNSEPWHVQPQELPGSRRDYERAGAAWGTNGEFSDAGGAPPTAGIPDTSEEHPSGSSGTRGMTLRSYLGMSVNDILETGRAEDLALFLANSQGRSSFDNGQSSIPKGGTTSTKALTGVLSGKEIVNLMSQVGRWSGDDLVRAVAISHRESRWDPNAYNPNAATRDLSYGLFQINMKDDDPKSPGMGKQRRKWFGISRNEELFDPTTNVRAARMMYDGRKGFYDWGGYKGKSDTYGTDMAMAAQTVREAMSGDPIGNSMRSSAGNTTSVVHEGATITIAPVINVSGGKGAGVDANLIATEVIRVIQQNEHLFKVRSS